jgi:hypothetical protein
MKQISIAVTALAVSVTFVLLSGALRIALQRRGSGDTGVRLPAVATAWCARLAMASGIVTCGVAAPIADLVGLEPLVLVSRPLRLIALALAAVGVVATFVAQAAMGQAWRTTVDESERTPLITTGVLAWCATPSTPP